MEVIMKQKRPKASKSDPLQPTKANVGSAGERIAQLKILASFHACVLEASALSTFNA